MLADGPDPFGMTPGNVWADEYARRGGLTAQDIMGQNAARQQAFDQNWAAYQEDQAMQDEAAQRAQQDAAYDKSSQEFVDWPTYKQSTAQDDVPPHKAYDDYVSQALPWHLSRMGYTPEEIQRELQIFSKMVQRPNPDYGFFGNLWESAKGGFDSGTRATRAAGNMVSGDTDALARLLHEQAGEEGPTDPLKKFYDTVGTPESRGSFWEAVKAYASASVDNPVGSVNFAVQQVSQMYPVLAAGLAGFGTGALAGPVGALAGGAAGTFAGSTTLETGAQILERIQIEAQARGIDVNDANAVARMIQDPTVYGRLRDAAVAKGLTVGAGDAALSLVTMGIGKAAATAARAGRGVRATALGVGAVGTEGAGSMGVEALSQVAAGDEFDFSQIVGEGYGGGQLGLVHAAMGAMLPGKKPAPTPAPAATPPAGPDFDEGDLPAAGGPPGLPPIRVTPSGGAFVGTADNVAAYDRYQQTIADAEAALEQVSQRRTQAALQRAEISEAEFEPIQQAIDEQQQIDGTDAEAIGAFLFDAGAPVNVPTVAALIQDLAATEGTNQQRLIAEAIDELVGKDAVYAEPVAIALIQLSRALPGRARQVVEDATVPAASEALLDTIRRVTGQRTAADRSASAQAWVDHFLSLPQRDAARVAIADEAWARSEMQARVEAMAELSVSGPVNQGSLDAAQAQLDRVVAALSTRTPMSRDKLQQLRARAGLLLEETINDHNRNTDQRADAGGSGAGPNGGAGPGAGGGGTGGLTRGGRSNSASAITPLQYRYLNTIGGRNDVSFSIGARRIADELGIDAEVVVPTIAEGLAHIALGMPLDTGGAFISLAEAPFAQALNPLKGILYHAQSPGLYRNLPYANTVRAEQATQARASLEAKRAGRTANAPRRGLKPGELIPTTDVVAGQRGPIQAGANTPEAAFQPGGRLYPSVPQEGSGQGGRDGGGQAGSNTTSQGGAGTQSDGVGGDSSVSRVAGTQYPMDERVNTRDKDDNTVAYVPRNPLARDSTPTTTRQVTPLVRLMEHQLEMEAKAKLANPTKTQQRKIDKWKKAQADAIADANAVFAEEAAVPRRNKGMTRKGLRKEADMMSEAMYEETYGRSYDADMADLLNIPEPDVIDTNARGSPDGLTADQVRWLSGDTNSVLRYLESTMQSPLARIVANQIRRLGLELPPITFGPLPSSRGPNESDRARYPSANFVGVVTHRVMVDPELATLGHVLHEYIHAATMKLLLEPENALHVEARVRLEQLMQIAKDAGLTTNEHYGMTDLYEFVSEALSNKEFQRLLAKIPVPANPKFSLFDAVKAVVMKLFGIEPNAKMSNVLLEVLGASQSVMSGKQFGPKGFSRLKKEYQARPSSAEQARLNARAEFARLMDKLPPPRDSVSTNAVAKLSVGSKVVRTGLPSGHPASKRVGTVVAMERGTDNRGRAMSGVRVLWDDDAGGVISEFTGRKMPAKPMFYGMSEVRGIGDSISTNAMASPGVAPAPGPTPRAAPSTAILGIKDGQRAFIAYAKGDQYTLYPVTAQAPAGMKGAGTSGLTREQVEQRIKDAGAQALAPTADSRMAGGTPANSAKRFVGFSPDGELRAMAFEQKDGTWTYYESDGDVRVDPDAKVIKGQSRDAVQRFITAKGLGPTAPTPTAVQPAATTSTSIGYDPAAAWQVTFADTERTLVNIEKSQVAAKVPWSQRVGLIATLRNSRVKKVWSDVQKQYIEPARLAGAAVSQRFGKTQEEVESILQNLHIVERMPNKIRQMQNGSMDAATLAAKTQSAQNKADAAQKALAAARGSNPAFVQAVQQELSPKIKQMSDHTIDLMASYGLITRNVAEEIKQSYDFYVPLQTGDKTSVGKASTGQNVTTDKSFARMAEQMERVIARGEQNRVRLAVLAIVESGGLHLVKDSNQTPVILKGATPKIRYDAATNSINESLDNHVFDENSITVYRAGEPITLTISDPTLLEALHPYKGEERFTAITGMLGLLARLNHIVAIGKTSLNPAFPFFNFARDAMTANINMPPGVSRLKYNMELVNPKTWGAVIASVLRGIVGKEGTSGFKRAADVGAFITHREFLGGTDEIASAMETMFQPGLKAKAKWGRSKLFDVLSVAAQISESVPRYAVYKAAIASGLSPTEAAYAAKTASVNFEKRGLKNLSNYWIFGNAKMQGLTALMDTSQRAGVLKSALGGTSLIALGALAAAIGYDKSEKDKDGKSKYAKVPDFRKDSLVLFKEGGFGIPIPQEIAPFYVLGNAVAEYRLGGTTFGQMGSRVFTSMMNNYIPSNIPQSDIVGHKARPVEFAGRAVMPSYVLPLIDLMTNHNTFGNDVVSGKETNLKRGMPMHLMGSPTENQLAVNAAKGLHDVTGGNVDAAPQQLKLLNNYFNPAAEGFAFWRDLLVDREPKYQGEVVNPLARRFTGAASGFYDQNQFEELLAKSAQAQYLAKEKGFGTLTPEEQALAQSATMLKRVETDSKSLFKGNKLLTPERRRMLNDRKQEMVLDGIRRYNELRDRTVARK